MAAPLWIALVHRASHITDACQYDLLSMSAEQPRARPRGHSGKKTVTNKQKEQITEEIPSVIKPGKEEDIEMEDKGRGKDAQVLVYSDFLFPRCLCLCSRWQVP